jgi:hypothetical protein
MDQPISARALRRNFLSQLIVGLKVVWPILIFLLSSMALLGLIVAMLEHWRLFDGIYFAFVSGLTIGYGDFAPKTNVGRLIAIVLGFLGILFTALVASVGVQAFNSTERT